MADQIEIFNVDLSNVFQSIDQLKAELKETRVLFNQAKPNTDEFNKYGAEVKRLESSIKLLNNSTKDQVNALGGVNKSTQFATGSYGQLRQQIEAQKKSLLSLTIGTDEFNQAQEELIKLENQRIEVEGKIPSLFQARVKGAIEEANTLKSLRAELKAANSAALNGDGKAAARAAELRDQLEDLKDTTNSLKGSGVERLNTSVRLLTEGFENFDSDKIKTGFKGIGAAMSAIPIVLLIEGVKVLIDNFDEVIKFVRVFTGHIDENAKAVERLTNEIKLQEAANIKLTTSIENEITLLEAQGASTDKIIAKKKELAEINIAQNDKEIEASKAKIKQIENESTVYETAKASILSALGFQTNAVQSVIDAETDRSKRIAEENTNIAKSESDTAKIRASIQAEQLKEAKKKSDELIDIAKKEQARLADIENEAIDKQEKKFQELRESEADAFFENELKYYDSVKKVNSQILSDNIARAELNLLNTKSFGEKELNARLELLNDQKEQELSNEQLTADQKALINAKYREKESQLRNQQLSNDLQAAGAATSALGDLSNSLYDVKRSNLEKGSEEDKQAAKEQFDLNKGFSIATALINGAVAVTNAFATLPYFANVVAAATAATTTTATVAKIASTKFQYFEGGYTTPGNPTEEAQSIGNKQFHKSEYVIPSRVLNTNEGSALAARAEIIRRGTTNPFPKIGGYFDGGFTNRSVTRQAQYSSEFTNQIQAIVSSMPPPILKVSDLLNVQQSGAATAKVVNL